MAIYRRYKVQRKYVNGQPTEEYRVGSDRYDNTDFPSMELCEVGSDCTDLEYRWVDIEGETICVGKRKFKKQIRQQRCVGTDTWVNLYPYEYQTGDLLEEKSKDCGYSDDMCLYYSYINGTDDYFKPSQTYIKSSWYSGSLATIIIDECGVITNVGSGTTTNGGSGWTNDGFFRSMSNLREVYLPAYTGSNGFQDFPIFRPIFGDCSNLEVFHASNLSYIYSHMFENCVKLSDVDFTKVNAIEESGFYKCSALTEISLPNVNNIKTNAFYGCANLSQVNLFSDIPVSFVNGTFSGCDSNLKLNVPDYLCSRYITDYMEWFQVTLNGGVVKGIEDIINCVSAEYTSHCIEVSFSNGFRRTQDDLTDTRGALSIIDRCGVISEIGSMAYMNDRKPYVSYLQYVEFPSCTHVYESAFYGVSSLVADIPNVQYIGSAAFKNCRLAQSMIISRCETIENEAFRYCSGLNQFSAAILKSIGNYAFFGCTNMSTISIPAIEYIGYSAFYNCGELRYIYMDGVKSVPRLASTDVFSLCTNLSRMFVSALMYDAFVTDSLWSYYSKYISIDSQPISNGNLFISYIDGNYNFFDYSSSALHSGVSDIYDFEHAQNIVDYYRFVITDIYESTFKFNTNLLQISLYKLNNIGREAFCGCERLSTVYTPYLTSVGDRAFFSCYNLEYMNLRNVNYIGYSAYGQCSKLSDIEIGQEGKSLYINSYAFAECKNLDRVRINADAELCGFIFNSCPNLQIISVPNARIIHESVFYNIQNITTISLAKVSDIWSGAFYSMPNLKTIDFRGISSIPSISQANQFVNCPKLSTIIVPSSLYDEFIKKYEWMSGMVISD